MGTNLKSNIVPPLEREAMEGYINLGLEPVIQVVTFEKENRDSIVKLKRLEPENLEL